MPLPAHEVKALFARELEVLLAEEATADPEKMWSLLELACCVRDRLHRSRLDPILFKRVVDRFVERGKSGGLAIQRMCWRERTQ